MKCPGCAAEMEAGFIYVRGMATSLHWSTQGDTGALSRRNLEMIDLGRISPTGARNQAVVPAARCASCGMAAFKTT